jgi:DNA-binding response OmpR family regulator
VAVIRVLLIEHDPSCAQLIERMLALSPIGFKITVSGTLKAAKTLLKESRFNLIVANLNSPDTKGLETVEAVRSAESSLPLVVLTGPEDVNLEPQAITRGAQFCLCRSEIGTKSLLSAMHQAVRNSRQTALSINDKQVNELLAQLEEDIAALKDALNSLEDEQRDTQDQEALQLIRSRIGNMHHKIDMFRQLQR